jgi:uncharacterized membrane protein
MPLRQAGAGHPPRASGGTVFSLRMHKARLEAFSDGVIAIIITIMVLELHVPHGVALEDLRPVLPAFLSYLMSFVYLAIYWNNHHHMLQASQHVNGRVLWANMHLLLWLSLIPFVTNWMGENHFAPTPVSLYGAVALGSGIAYYILARSLVRLHGPDSAIAHAIGADRKGIVSVIIYAVAVPLALVNPLVSLAMYVTVSIMWLVPDSRVERALGTHDAS